MPLFVRVCSAATQGRRLDGERSDGDGQGAAVDQQGGSTAHGRRDQRTSTENGASCESARNIIVIQGVTVT